MEEFLVGIVYHEPRSYELWKAGHVEDYESSTGIFISAENESEAIEWGEQVAQKLFEKVNPEQINPWKSFDYTCWIVQDRDNSYWNHCLDFFQHVNLNELPDFEKMGSEAYLNWQLEKGLVSQEIFDANVEWQRKLSEWMKSR